MRLIAYTYVHENYGAHGWDGMGSCPQAWKSKGTCEYLLANVSMTEALALGKTGLQAIVDNSRSQIEQDNAWYQQKLTSWELLADGELTPFERDQLEYEGRITYTPRDIHAKTSA